MAVYIASLVIAIICICMIVSKFGKMVPTNYILLAGFTVAESIMVGGITARYDPNTVMCAGAATALTTISLTIYALRTKVKLEFFAALIYVAYFAMLPILILSIFMFSELMYVVYNVLGVFLYSCFLIYDTIVICKGKTSGGAAISYDDYI